jgi:hypothetical protein
MDEQHMAEKWVVDKKPDDPICPRISVGGIKGEGGYVTFRGDPVECNRLLIKASEELSRYILANPEEAA